MATNMLEQMQAVDLSVLTEIVRQDQHSPDLEIINWSVRPFTTKGVINSDGLFLYEGRGRDVLGEKVWRVVAKTFQADPNAPPPDHFFYWKRELELFHSNLLARLPGPVRHPCVYAVQVTPQGGILWLEYLSDNSPERWTLEQFAFAARQAGRWNGRCLQNQIFPQDAWLCREPLRGWLEAAGRVSGWKDYTNPVLQQAISRQTLDHALQLFDEREYWFDLLNRLPQVFSHFDMHRRNMMIHTLAAGQDELILIDWALAGIGPLGGELHALIAANAMLFEVDISHLEMLERAAFDAYLSGLRQEGWNENPDLVRLAYDIWTGLRLGAAGPALISSWSSAEWQARSWPLFHCGSEDVIAGFAQLCAFALDRADEARRLMDRLRL